MPSRLLSLDRLSIIAHRGGAALRPENTMAAFDYAAGLGVDAIELDVHLSRDREVVVIHDETVDRTTDGRGPVGALTAAELGRLDAGCRFDEAGGCPFRARAGGVPRLADVLVRHPSLAVVVEIKGDAEETAVRTIETIARAAAGDRVIVGGFSDRVLRVVRDRAPGLPTSASAPEARAAARRAVFGLAPRPSGFHVFQVPIRLRGRQVLGPRFVRRARRAGYPVHVWVVNTPADMRLVIDWGATGLITDRPDIGLGLGA